MAGATEQQTGHEHAADEEREDLFGVVPGLREPFAGLAFLAGRAPRQPGDGHEERERRVRRHEQRGGSGRKRGESEAYRRELKPAPEHDAERCSESGGQPPFHGINGGEESGRRVGVTPVGEHEDCDHQAKEHGGLPQWTRGLRLGQRRHLDRLGLLLVAEQPVHQRADDDGEHDRADCARDADLHAEDFCGEDDREGIDRRAGVEKRRRRPEPGAHAVDAGEERQHSAGAHGEDRARDRRDAVAGDLRGVGPEVFHHRLLGDEGADGSRDPERREQAQDHVFLRVPLGECQRLGHRPVETWRAQWHEIDGGEDRGHPSEGGELFFLIHSWSAVWRF